MNVLKIDTALSKNQVNALGVLLFWHSGINSTLSRMEATVDACEVTVEESSVG